MHYKAYKTILSPQNGMNIYRGCSHGCIYCDGRSLCYQMKHEFEDIEVKERVSEMLENELIHKRKKCMVGTGAMSDPYIHLEEKLGNTHACLEVIERRGFGLAIQTKSNRILRDLDLLKKINKKSKCIVQMTLTTYDEEMCKLIEPNVCTTKERFEVLKIMKENDIETVVWFSPLLPFINDTEENLRGILSYCIEAKVKGIICFGIGVTLRDGDREYFYENLEKKFKGIRKKYIERYGNSYECTSDNNDRLMKIFQQECISNKIMYNPNQIFTYMKQLNSPEEAEQMSLFN